MQADPFSAIIGFVIPLKPIIEDYDSEALLEKIDATKSIDEVALELMMVLVQRNANSDTQKFPGRNEDT